MTEKIDFEPSAPLDDPPSYQEAVESVKLEPSAPPLEEIPKKRFKFSIKNIFRRFRRKKSLPLDEKYEEEKNEQLKIVLKQEEHNKYVEAVNKAVNTPFNKDNLKTSIFFKI